MLFNIYIRDVFTVVNDTDIAYYADDIKPYINSLTDNQIKGRKDKCHVLFSTVKTLQINLVIGAALINSSKCEEPLGVMSTQEYMQKM